MTHIAKGTGYPLAFWLNQLQVNRPIEGPLPVGSFSLESSIVGREMEQHVEEGVGGVGDEVLAECGRLLTTLSQVSAPLDNERSRYGRMHKTKRSSSDFPPADDRVSRYPRVETVDSAVYSERSNKETVAKPKLKVATQSWRQPKEPENTFTAENSEMNWLTSVKEEVIDEESQGEEAFPAVELECEFSPEVKKEEILEDSLVQDHHVRIKQEVKTEADVGVALPGFIMYGNEDLLSCFTDDSSSHTISARTHCTEKFFTSLGSDLSLVKKEKLVETIGLGIMLKEAPLIIPRRQDSGERPFFCFHCGFTTSLKSSLIIHMKSHSVKKPFSHSMDENCAPKKGSLIKRIREQTGKKPFLCLYCRYSSSQKHRLIHHIKIHSIAKHFVCYHCDYTASNKLELSAHLLKHSRKRPFPCPQCGYSGTNKDNLIKHMMIHTGERPFPCSECDYSATRIAYLISHMKRHTGEKPFPCSLCNYSASLKHHLDQHMKTHTGEKPYVCSQCPYSASHKTDLNKHIRIHTGERPFSCTECAYSTSDKSTLSKHIKTHEK